MKLPSNRAAIYDTQCHISVEHHEAVHGIRRGTAHRRFSHGTRHPRSRHPDPHRRVAGSLAGTSPSDPARHPGVPGERALPLLDRRDAPLFGDGLRDDLDGGRRYSGDRHGPVGQRIRAAASFRQARAGNARGAASLWDETTAQIDELWPQIPPPRFHEVDTAFGAYEGVIYGLLLYWIDNEIHHRGQGYVYLRALGIEPPAFYDRS